MHAAPRRHTCRTMDTIRHLLLLGLADQTSAAAPWTRIGPWNIIDDKDIKGESGTLASAASPAAHPEVIYAGGQNNGVSSGVVKTVDGGMHWKLMSKGLWDTRVLGVCASTQVKHAPLLNLP